MPSNFPFHVARGNHTSNRTEGLLTPTTRQNTGMSLRVVPSGGVKDGPVVSRTDSIFVSGISRDIRFPHDSAAGADLTASSDNNSTNRTMRFTMRRLYHCGVRKTKQTQSKHQDTKTRRHKE